MENHDEAVAWDFLKEHTTGWQEYVEAVKAGYKPEDCRRPHQDPGCRDPQGGKGLGGGERQGARTRNRRRDEHLGNRLQPAPSRATQYHEPHQSDGAYRQHIGRPGCRPALADRSTQRNGRTPDRRPDQAGFPSISDSTMPSTASLVRLSTGAFQKSDLDQRRRHAEHGDGRRNDGASTSRAMSRRCS